MKADFLSILLMLVTTITIIAIPASAGELTITFDEGRLDADDEIGSTYSDLGVIFSPGAIVDTKFGSGEDLGFWNPNNHISTIYFSPAVKSVSIEFEDAIIGNMDALLVNGEKLSTSKWNWLITTNTLRIESKTENIQKIEISEGSQCINLIKLDSLRYNQILEFSTVAFPIAAVMCMMFIFQRRKN